MRQILLLAVVTIMTCFQARAEQFNCTFSEPALNVRYDSESGELTLKKDMLGIPEVTSGVSFHILSTSIFVLKNSGGKQLAKITLNNNGSDGLTETLYPFEIQINSLANLSNRGIGGCSSSLLKSVRQ